MRWRHSEGILTARGGLGAGRQGAGGRAQPVHLINTLRHLSNRAQNKLVNVLLDISQESEEPVSKLFLESSGSKLKSV